MSETLTHKGIVIEEDNGQGALVEVQRESACGSCHEKGSCAMNESGSMLIRVKSPRRLSTGDSVTVQMKRKEFYRSVGLVYIIPVILMLVTAIIADSLTTQMPRGELITAAATLLAPVIYFPMLRIFLKKNEKGYYMVA
jgi:sigma-E factor negative regulatory protein RseC